MLHAFRRPPLAQAPGFLRGLDPFLYARSKCLLNGNPPAVAENVPAAEAVDDLLFGVHPLRQQNPHALIVEHLAFNHQVLYFLDRVHGARISRRTKHCPGATWELRPCAAAPWAPPKVPSSPWAASPSRAFRVSPSRARPARAGAWRRYPRPRAFPRRFS